VLARSLVVQIDGACLLFKVDSDGAAFDAALDAIGPNLIAVVRASAPVPEQTRPSPIRQQ
jgi:hypothetical protein